MMGLTGRAEAAEAMIEEAEVGIQQVEQPWEHRALR
jgi:hypothetical protein